MLMSPKSRDQELIQSSLYQQYLRIANAAYAERKIFEVYGNFRTIRNGLLRRGWIEKIPPENYKKLQEMSRYALLKKAEEGNDYEKVLLSKTVASYPAFFSWLTLREDKNVSTESFLCRNRMKRGTDYNFTTKLGLIGCAEAVHWYTEPGKSELLYPRFYRMHPDEHRKFLEDFRLTECFSLLTFVNNKEDELHPLYSTEGLIPSTTIKFAIDRVLEFVKNSIHTDVDDPLLGKTNAEWTTFITNSRSVISRKHKLRCVELDFNDYRDQIKKTLEEAKHYWPTLQMDGYNNIWIMKPGFSTRGRGIVLMNEYDKIIEHAKKYESSKYMVQKYIERPLLIYKTKFDIRQYFLMTVFDNVDIWMYKDCYLRFSSQEFTLDSLLSSIHLTNNSIQKNYKNGQRSASLPDHNMWSLSEFQSYLKKNVEGKVWSLIYEGMKKCIISVVQASLIDTDMNPRTFDIFGCDFMVNEQFEPYLIEVNASPDMSPSTEVTKRICPMALEDLLKVVVDLQRNSKASTGNFERIFSTPLSKIPMDSPELLVHGVAIKNNQSKELSEDDLSYPDEVNEIVSQAKKQFSKFGWNWLRNKSWRRKRSYPGN